MTIEDAAELMLRQRHVVRLETRPANIEGKGDVRQRDLVVNALRMRPDRIIVGEVRGEEALDMLQAMNTGHDGSLTTIHANSARDALYRLDTMVAMANLNIPERAIRQQIASAINLIVQVTRLSDGTRKVTGITEITGMEGDVITMQDIFLFEQTGLGQDGKVCGPLPRHRHPAEVQRAARGVGRARCRRTCSSTSRSSAEERVMPIAIAFVSSVAAAIILGAYWLFVVRPEEAAQRRCRGASTERTARDLSKNVAAERAQPLSSAHRCSRGSRRFGTDAACARSSA